MNVYIRGPLHRLSKRYIAGTVGEMNDLRGQIRSVAHGHPEWLPRIVASAHRMAGAAALFGFPQVSDCARRIVNMAGTMELSAHPNFQYMSLTAVGGDLDNALIQGTKARNLC